MKVAIVHDWFVGWGAEAVVFELHKMYPDAPIYTAYCNEDWRQRLDGKVATSYMQHWPLSKLRKFLPVLRAMWFSSLDLADYDLVISSSGAEAKAVKVKKPAIHINYCHAPTHYYWSRYDEYMKNPGFGWLNPLARLGLKILIGPMRRWDLRASKRPDYMIANSNYTKAQIKKYYGRDSAVIHPPVNVEAFRPKIKAKQSGFLIAGRQTPYKRFGLAIEACTKLDLPLVVAGDGPDNKRLKRLAGPSIKFVGSPGTQPEMAKLLQAAEAFIFPGTDDFGIVAVEAMASGTPVIAYGQGGALDYISRNTGLLFDQQTVESLSGALKKFKASNFKSVELLASAGNFAPAIFRQKVSAFIKSAL